MVRCPKCNEENPRKFLHCGYCGTPLHAKAPAEPLRSHEVRRTVSILFCDLKDSTSLGERLDPEALHELKERYFGAMAAEITRHGGKIEKYIGDAVMAVFGLPVQHEDDALRAVRAAEGMRIALRALNEQLEPSYGLRLDNRTGVNTGEVVANDDPTADQKLATGDTVNVTARLEQAAPANEIYIGKTTWQLVQHDVEVEAVAPLTLKGKQETEPAFRLVSVTASHDAGRRRRDTPLIGRDSELLTIQHSLRAVSETGTARLVTLVGDAGIGKSRLAQEVIACASARVLHGRCLAYGEGITFWPLREMVGEAAGILLEDTPETAFHKIVAIVTDADIAERLAAAIGLSGAAFPIHETSWAARKFFKKLGQGQPLVVLVDDIHWAEPAFLDLLETVVGGEDTGPVLVLCTARHELLERRQQWSSAARSMRLVLNPLNNAEAARVADNALGTCGLPPQVVQRIVAAAEGNPLYVEQMLLMLVESEALRWEDERWLMATDHVEIVVPPSIKALLEARIAQLPVEERDAIQPASVIGLQFPVPAVASMAPHDERLVIEDHLIALAEKQLVHAVPLPDEDRVYRFHHQLVRDTVYNGLLKRKRAMLHVEFVRWADQVNAERGRALEFEEILGYHLEQAHRCLTELNPLDDKARDLGRDAARRLASAARRSVQRGDVHAAENLFRRGIDLLHDADADRRSLLREYADVLLELGKFAEAEAISERASALAEAAGDIRVKSAADLVRMNVRLQKSELAWSEAAAHLTTVTIPLLEQHAAHAELAQAWRLVALAQQTAGSLSSSGEAIQMVASYARMSGDLRLVARSALGLTFNALYGPTPVEQALRQCQEFVSADFHDRQVQGLIMSKVAQLRAMNGEFDEGRTLYHEARRLLNDLGQTVRAATCSLDFATIELLAGNPAAAERELRVDYEALVRVGATYFVASMAAMLARAVRDQGRDDEALELTQTAEAAAADDDVEAQVRWRCVRGPILARAGKTGEAEALVRFAIDRATRTEAPTLHAFALTELASVLQCAGRPEEARQSMANAIAIYAAKGDVASAAQADRALACMSQ